MSCFIGRFVEGGVGRLSSVIEFETVWRRRKVNQICFRMEKKRVFMR